MRQPQLRLTWPSLWISHLSLRLGLLVAAGEAKNCGLVQSFVLLPSLCLEGLAFYLGPSEATSLLGKPLAALAKQQLSLGRNSHAVQSLPKAVSPRHRGGSAGTLTSTAIKIGPARQGEEGEGQEPTAAHLALGTGGPRAVSWVLCCPPALPPAGWAFPGLSCSGPLCPPPAPVCSEAAAFEPAHLFLEPPESRPCTWRCRSRSRAGHSCC